MRTFSLNDVPVHATQQYAPDSGGRSPGSQTLATPPPRALEDEELFVIEASSSSVLTTRARCRRKEWVVPSMASAEESANNGAPRRGTPAAT